MKVNIHNGDRTMSCNVIVQSFILCIIFVTLHVDRFFKKPCRAVCSQLLCVQITYNMNRLSADHERGSISIARRNVPMYKIANIVEDELFVEETDPPPRCPPKEPPPKPADPCQVAPSGLAAL